MAFDHQLQICISGRQASSFGGTSGGFAGSFATWKQSHSESRTEPTLLQMISISLYHESHGIYMSDEALNLYTVTSLY